MARFIALDLGTSRVKGALLNEDGRVLSHAEQEYPTARPMTARAEQRIPAWWDAIDRVAKALVVERGAPDAVALTGQMQDVILLDERGQPVRSVILYSDQRAQFEAGVVESVVGGPRMQQLTGLTPRASGLLEKLVWLTRHEKRTLKNTHTILLGAADAAVFHWCGTAATDTTTASTTGLMALEARTWIDQAMFDALDLGAQRAKLPRLLPGGALAGHITTEAAQRTGLTAGTPVYLGPGDAGTTGLGAGSGEPGSAYFYIGTSGWVGLTTATRPEAEMGVFSLAHPRPGHYFILAPMQLAGGNIDWIQDVLDGPEHAELIKVAASMPGTPLVYLPYLTGERSPFEDPHARGAFIGLSAAHTAPDLARAVLEGVAFSYRHVLETLMPTPPVSLALTGGGARSPAWNQMIADITGVTITVDPDSDMVGLRGAWLAARVARGEAASYTLKTEQAKRYKPNQGQRARYQKQYDLFRDAYTALKPLFARQAE
ncbi:MAG TPA: FGGY family carbohydrate kinase [Candidatus Limnocylindrales bacterium]|nr:FGGY family carbohydrate kinase [Candidatus Limnocylindrales bacterium]